VKKSISKPAVKNYWRRFPDANKYFNSDWDKYEKSCFACGSNGKTIDAAHIVARTQYCEEFLNCEVNEENVDKPANIHLLCRLCHVESEMLIGIAYWHWLSIKSTIFNEGKLNWMWSLKPDKFSNGHNLEVMDSLISSARKGCPSYGAEYSLYWYDKETEIPHGPKDEWITDLNHEIYKELDILKKERKRGYYCCSWRCLNGKTRYYPIWKSGKVILRSGQYQRYKCSNCGKQWSGEEE
jgi:hypothetical protein